MIDLGQISATEVPAWPSRRRLGKRWLSVALAVAILLLVGAASSGGPDPMPLVTTLAINPSAPLTIVGNRVFVLDKAGDGTWIHAYALAGGHLQWTARVSDDRTAGRIYTIGTTLVADTTYPNGAAHTVAGFDPATGHEQWNVVATDTVHIGPALFIWPPASGFDGAPTRMARIDPVTGRTIWSTSIGDACQWQFDDGATALATGLVVLCAHGADLSVIDLATGRIRSHRSLDETVLDNSNLVVRDGMIVVAAFAIPYVDIAGYRGADLRPIWTHTVGNGSALAGGCDVQVCVETPTGMQTLDLRTGVVVPTVDSTATSPIGLHPSSGVFEFLVVPPAKATILAPFDVSLESMAPAGQTVSVGDYQPGHGTTTWITQQLRDGSYRPVAPLIGVGGDCGFTSGYVLCATAPRRVSIWRLPPVT